MLRSLAGGRLFGEVTGDGPPTVLALHGWRRTHGDFSAVLAPPDGTSGERPGDDGRPLDAVAPDLPGFGATPAPAEAWGSSEYAACVAELLDDMAGPVVVIGHSFGGRVAVQLAAARPEAVRALVLTGVPLLPPATDGAGRLPPTASCAPSTGSDWWARQGWRQPGSATARRTTGPPRE